MIRMHRVPVRLPILAMLLLFTGGLLAAQVQRADTVRDELDRLPRVLSSYPAWLLLEKGKQLRLEGRLSDAFTYFFAAQEKRPEDPAIEVELARAFLQSGDIRFSRVHLNRAIEKKRGFSSPEAVYDVWYMLSDLALIQESYFDYEGYLKEIVKDDVQFNSTATFDVNTRRLYIQSLLENGIDRTLLLYRIPDSFSLEAHRRLGIFYVQSGRYSEALPHLVFAILKSYTKAIQEYRSRELDFRFSTLLDFHRRIESNPGIREYLVSVGIYESLYYLAEGIYGFDRTRKPSADGVWRFLAAWQDGNQFGAISAEQLRSPRTYLRFDGNR